MSRKSLLLAGTVLPVAALLSGAGYLALTWYRTRNYFWGPVAAAFAADQVVSMASPSDSHSSEIA